MVTPLCNNTYSRSFTYTFSNPLAYPVVFGPSPFPSFAHHQYYSVNGLVDPYWLFYTRWGNIPVNGIEVYSSKSTCQDVINSMINIDPVMRTQLTEIGCAPVFNNGTYSTGCQFDSTTQNGRFGDTLSTGPFGDVEVINYKWECSVTDSDPKYRPVCCNSVQSNVIIGTDPFTGLPFNTNSCDINWCLNDPYGECADIFQECTNTSPCHRHWLLTNYPKPNNDPSYSLTILPDNGHGVRCYDWYATTKIQAALRNLYPSGYSNTVRVENMMNTISEYCSNPNYLGHGECSCFNGYLSYNVPWTTTTTDLADQYENSTLPYLVEMFGNSARRLDAFCADNNPSFTQLLSYSLNSSYITYSNVCSNTVPWSSYEYNRPSLSPSKSIRSLTNFGDVAALNSPLFDNTVGDTLPLPMPFHCWLPACIGSDQVVFRNLWALGIVTCPSVCYQVSSGDSIDIAGGDYAHIHENYVSCDFKPYTSSVFPYSLPSTCQVININAPTNFQGFIHIPVGNPTLDTSSSYIYSTMTAFTDSFPIISLYNGTDFVTSLSTSISKYSYSTDSIYVMSVSLNTTNTNPFNSLISNLTLLSDQGISQEIVFQITVWDDNFASVSCIPCDPTFGTSCPLEAGPIIGQAVGNYGGQDLYRIPQFF